MQLEAAEFDAMTRPAGAARADRRFAVSLASVVAEPGLLLGGVVLVVLILVGLLIPVGGGVPV